MKVKAIWRNNKLCFTHFLVKKESENFFGVYHHFPPGVEYGEVVTSAETFSAAAKKAKLLEIGYQECLDSM